ncbi:hypothetical protein ACMFMG_005855 [Clarireedia jacksonii]
MRFCICPFDILKTPFVFAAAPYFSIRSDDSLFIVREKRAAFSCNPVSGRYIYTNSRGSTSLLLRSLDGCGGGLNTSHIKDGRRETTWALLLHGFSQFRMFLVCPQKTFSKGKGLNEMSLLPA